MAGALVYLVLRFSLSPQATLLIQLFTPVLMLVTYFFVLGKPGTILPTEVKGHRHGIGEDAAHSSQGDDDKEDWLLHSEEESGEEGVAFTGTANEENRRENRFHIKLFNREELEYWWSHVKYVPRLLFRYMFPLFAVYMAEYMINQGLYELFLYPHTHLGGIHVSQASQYRV